MQYQYQRSLFLFRRDLRLDDNTGLLRALESSREVIPVFILDPRQVGSTNRFRNEHSLQFMAASLEGLEEQLTERNGRLHYSSGLPHRVVEGLIQSELIEAVFVNRDYTPFSLSRDADLQHVCAHHGIPFVRHDDYLLTTPGEVHKQDGKPYTLFTAFYKAASIHPASPVRRNRYTNYAVIANKRPSVVTPTSVIGASAPSTTRYSGRIDALNILKRLGRFADYALRRDFLNQSATTALSPHLKFGTLSVRELVHAVASQLGDSHPLIRQLYWRDFFTHIAFHFPHIFSGSFHQRYDGIKWLNNRRLFKRWCDGQTGVPIVDAGMRQLNQTGEMHNRVRMITASFLIKDLHVDWRWGEHYFAQHLTDYDPSVNNGNWQWVASTGCDAAPYFRIFNPWVQQTRFDPDCRYVKRWIPELKDLDPLIIHDLNRRPAKPAAKYPRPVVDHAISAKITSQLYREARD